MKLDTRHWSVPHPDRATEGIVEGMPTPEQHRELVERATKERAEWAPSPEAWQQLIELHALVGRHVRIQFWNPIMVWLEEEGPNPLYALCVGIVSLQTDGVLQPHLLLEDPHELKTPEGSSPMGYAVETAGYSARLALVADICEIEAVTPDGYAKAVYENTPRMNRVTPLGEIIRDPAYGTLMGNRGHLHNTDRELTRQFDPGNVRWTACQLEFKGRKRKVMALDQYTELFFLDEATALSAGHRPCAECRRTRYNQFVKAWQAGNPKAFDPDNWTVDQLDSVIAAERMDSTGKKITYLANLDDLPDGTMVLWPPEEDKTTDDKKVPVLVHGTVLRKWRPKGYTSYGRARRPNVVVRVVTPRSVVNALKSGYVLTDLPSRPGTILSSKDSDATETGDNELPPTRNSADKEASVDNLFQMLDGP